MSGYVLLVLQDEDLQKVLPIFRNEETTAISLPSGRTMISVTNSGTTNRGSFFQGYGIDHAGGAMVFSDAPTHELPDPATPLEGSYVVAKVDENAVRIGADIFGFVPLLWFSEANATAVSDSYLTLIAIREALGLRCTIDEETIRGRMWLNAISSQQLGRETYCREIRYATPGTELRFNLLQNSLVERPLKLDTFFSSFGGSHREAIVEAGVRMVRTLKTYAATGATVELALSGGHDSRVCLAAAVSAGIEESLFVSSSISQADDFAISTMLSEHLNFPLNQARSADGKYHTKRIDTTGAWASSTMGIYDSLYMPGLFPVDRDPIFSLGGHGAETSKGAFGWKPIADIPMPPSASRQGKRALQAIGISSEDKWGSEWHYLAFRNAIHGGRAILASDYVARPPAQSPLIGLSRSELNEFPTAKRGRPNVILDVLIALQPGLAELPFDNPVKNVDREFISSRLDALGGKISTDGLQAYRVIGRPYGSCGFLESQMDIARSKGFTGGLSAANLLGKVRSVADDLSDLVPGDVRAEIDAFSPDDANRIPASSRGSVALGKLLAISSLSY